MIACLLRYALHGFLEHRLPFSSFILATLLTEYFWGLGPAIMVFLLSMPAANFFFMPPFNQFDVLTLDDVVQLTGIMLICVVGIALIESLRRTKYEAQLLMEVAESRYDMLLRSDAARKTAETAHNQSQKMLQTMVSVMPNIWVMMRVNGGFEYIDVRLFEMTGMDSQIQEPQRWLRMLHPDDMAPTQALLQTLSQTPGQSMVSQFRLVLADGDYQYCQGIYTSSSNQHGTVIRLENVELGEVQHVLPV